MPLLFAAALVAGLAGHKPRARLQRNNCRSRQSVNSIYP